MKVFELFQENFVHKESQMRKKCKYITPILDILPITQLYFDRSNMNFPHFTDGKYLNQNFIGISFEKFGLKGEEINITSIDPFQIDIFYSITGKIKRNFENYIQIIYRLFKKDYNRELSDLCSFWGCTNLDLKRSMDKFGDLNIPFYFTNQRINLDFLQMIKLKFMKNQTKEVINNYQYVRYTNYNLEIKAGLIYLKNIVEEEGLNRINFLNLLKDYLKLRGIYKSINNFSKMNSAFSGLENKINIVEVGLIIEETRIIQEHLILEKLIGDVKIDLIRLKDSYIN